MRVDPPNPDSLHPAPADRPQQKPAKDAAGTAERDAAADAVDLSSLANAPGDAGPREVRLEQLRAEVRSGAYQAPALDVAAKIIDDAVK